MLCEDVKVIAVPHYENLTLDLILDFGLASRAVVNALPVIREVRKMPRGYICNVIYTLVGKPFATWVTERCKDRNQRFQESKGLEVKLQTRVAEALAASTAVNRK